jgi:hypothetical protein
LNGIIQLANPAQAGQVMQISKSRTSGTSYANENVTLSIRLFIIMNYQRRTLPVFHYSISQIQKFKTKMPYH